MFPSGRLIFSGFLDNRLLSTSTPSIMKMDVAPVSAIAWSESINMPAAISVVFGVVVLERFDATTVMSSCIVHIKFRMGSEEDCVVAETK
jgi:hypothetical protein